MHNIGTNGIFSLMILDSMEAIEQSGILQFRLVLLKFYLITFCFLLCS